MPHPLIVPLPTPFTPGGSVDVARVGQMIDRVGGLASHFTIAGRVGEGTALTPVETMALGEAAARRAPVLIDLGGLAPHEALLLARASAGCGAAGLMLAPPKYWPLAPVDLARYYATLIAAAGLTAYAREVTGAALGSLAGVTGMAGLVLAARDVAHLSEGARALAAAGSSVTLFCRATDWAAASSIGIQGVFDSLPLVAPSSWRELDAAALAASLIDGHPSILKTVLRLSGLDIGTARPPYRELDDLETRQLARLLAGAGNNEGEKIHVGMAIDA